MIPRRCERCGRAVWVWPWQRVVCRSSQEQVCLGIEEAIRIEDGLEPTPWPTMLDWRDQPPVDIDDCSGCGGLGRTVVRVDWVTGPVIDTCPRCLGTKVDPTRCPT